MGGEEGSASILGVDHHLPDPQAGRHSNRPRSAQNSMSQTLHCLLPLALLLATACQSADVPPAFVEPPAPDEHSFSRPDRVRVTHVDLDLDRDFERKLVEGVVTLDLDRLRENEPLLLDTDGLEILQVAGADGELLRFDLGAEVPRFGRPLKIALRDGDSSVAITYRTTQGADALQWLGPEQTADGLGPFLYTQGQAVLTRSWIPLQDTPGVRVTYSARVRAPEGLTVLMSAVGRGQDGEGAWSFVLEQPVPAYLIALAAGHLESRDVSERVAIWAEPSLVEAAAWEFADTEQMVQEAEKLFGPYRWDRYDVLILPSAFPYGGMENPLLTFLTPTVLAGDRSLVSIIAHELAHSWSGNLVTNATWRDFWLNEGTTVYFERRIMEQIYGEEIMATQAALDMVDLADTVDEMEPWETELHVDLSGKHPDDGCSIPPYYKGAAFFHRLEEAYGREVLDAFLRAWFDENAFQSVETAWFETFLTERLLDRNVPQGDPVAVRHWIHGAGLPADAPVFESDLLARVEAQVKRYEEGTPAEELDTEDWISQQWLHFVETLAADTPPESLARLDAAFDLTNTGNNEVLCAWMQRGTRAGYEPVEPRLEAFLLEVGRRKYLTPLYRALLEVDAERARDIYDRARPRYHSVSTKTLDGIFRNAGA